MTLDNISLNLLDNGLDFIIRGLDELLYVYDSEERFIIPVSQPQKDYKYGIIHLFAGFLLLLKEKLSRDTPKLIYRDFPKKSERLNQHLNQGIRPSTVDLHEALKRLKLLDNIESRVNFTESDMSVIEKIQDYRNTFEHYKIESIKILELKNLIICFIDLIGRFLNEHLEINIITSLHLSSEIRVKIVSITILYDRIVKDYENAINLL